MADKDITQVLQYIVENGSGACDKCPVFPCGKIKDYEDKVMSYLNYLGTVGKKEQTYNGPVYSNVDYPNKTVGAVLMEMVTNQCGKCPDPVYEYTYEISLDGIEKKIIDQETYDRLCDMTNCIQNKL